MIRSIRSLHSRRLHESFNGYFQSTLLDGIWNASPMAEQRRTMAGYRKGGFRPKRRPDKNYRPLQIPKKRIRVAMPGNANTIVEVQPDTGAINDVDMEKAFGGPGAELIETIRNERYRKLQQYKLGGHLQPRDEAEESLRMLDYYIADEGSLEDRVGERRALSIDEPTASGREKFAKYLDEFVKAQTLADMDLDPESIAKNYPIKKYRDMEFATDDSGDAEDIEDDDPEVMFDPDQLAYGQWSELLITVDRNVSLWRGGRLESYRALVIGGNFNGCKYQLLHSSFGTDG
jgi:hypothetical protein